MGFVFINQHVKMCVIFIYEFFRSSLFNGVLFWSFGYHGVLQNSIEKERDCSLPCFSIGLKYCHSYFAPSLQHYLTYLFIYILYFMQMSVWLYVCMHTMCVPDAHRSLNRLSDPLKQELGVVASHHVDMGLEYRTCARGANALDCGVTSL